MKVKKLNSDCLSCLVKKHLTAFPKDAPEEDKLTYMKRVMKLLSEAKEWLSAPEIVEEVNFIKEELFGKTSEYGEIKKYFNALMLNEEASLSAELEKSDNPLKKAFLFAMKGNYIDFGAMYSVDDDVLKKSFYGEEDNRFDDEFSNLVKDLERAERLLYITDNCGEIVADKLFINEIKKAYPALSVNALVRGREVLNDATIEDAKEVGLDKVVSVIENGTGVPGTSIDRISPRAREALLKADVIISKGQGNFETLMHSGRNIYYIFLCKCDMFAKRFGVETLTGMFLNDLRMDN